MLNGSHINRGPRCLFRSMRQGDIFSEEGQGESYQAMSKVIFISRGEKSWFFKKRAR